MLPFLVIFLFLRLIATFILNRYDNKNGRTEAKSRGSDQDTRNALFSLKSCPKAENEASSLWVRAE